MATAFKLPVLGENVTAGTIARVLVKPGDGIKKGQPVLEVETDKAVVEVPAPGDGKVTEVKVKDGQKVSVGDLVLSYEAGAASAAPAAAPAPAAVAAPAQKAAPKLTVLDPPARPAAAPAPAPKTAPVAAVARAGVILASPSVRRLAREMGVDLNTMPTTDPSGRVTAQDVLNFAHSGGSAAPAAPPLAASAPATAAPVAASPARSGDASSDKWGAVVLEPMNAIRRKTVEHMTTCWTTIPHVTHFDKADITALEEARKKYAKKIEAAGGKLTITCFLLKVLATALKKFPRFNSSIDLANERLVLRQYYHVGVAADTPNGLLVPVVRNVDQKSIAEIAVELPALAQKARERKLALDDMQGGTFTVSNLGGLGGHAFTPIINAPEVAILGVSRSVLEPVWQNGQFVPRLMLPLSLSYDHRVIDGADAARFARYLCETIEQPWSLFLD